MEKTRHLLEALRSYGSLAVALSGGVDSSVLTRAAAMAHRMRNPFAAPSGSQMNT